MTSSLNRAKVFVGASGHVENCLRIAKRLPKYFNEVGLEEMRRSLSSDILYMAFENECLVGFAAIGGEEETEITWLAIDPAFQGKGIGRTLIGRIEAHLARRGVKLLTVKTLAAEANYPPYEATRTFYEKNGFSHVETIHSHPDWGGEPAAVYTKVLSTRETECG